MNRHTLNWTLIAIAAAVPIVKDAATSGPTLHVKEWPKEWGSLRREEMYGDDGR